MSVEAAACRRSPAPEDRRPGQDPVLLVVVGDRPARAGRSAGPADGSTSRIGAAVDGSVGPQPPTRRPDGDLP